MPSTFCVHVLMWRVVVGDQPWVVLNNPNSSLPATGVPYENKICTPFGYVTNILFPELVSSLFIFKNTLLWLVLGISRLPSCFGQDIV